MKICNAEGAGEAMQMVQLLRMRRWVVTELGVSVRRTPPMVVTLCPKVAVASF